MSKAHIKKTANAREFTEGAYGYTIDATDMNGNTSETRGQINKITGEPFVPNEASYATAVYYDVTPPTISGEYKDGILDLTITDIKQ